MAQDSDQEQDPQPQDQDQDSGPQFQDRDQDSHNGEKTNRYYVQCTLNNRLMCNTPHTDISNADQLGC